MGLKEKFLQQNNSLLDIGDRVNDNKDNIDKMEEKIDGLCKTVEIIEGRQVEVVEKVREVTVLFGNLQQQIKDQEEKIIEKSATDLTQIKNQIKDIESHNDLSDKKIKDLDSGSQALLEKLIGLEKEFGDRFVSLDKTDDNMLIKINSLESGNIQNITDIRNEVEKRLDDVGNKLQVDHESLRKETLVLVQDMSSVKTHITNTENKFVEIDAGNQQLLEKLLGIEKDLDDKLHGVNENTNIIQTKLNSIDEENKNNTQNIFNIHESIRIQTEQVQKVDDERQQAIAKAKEDFEANAASNEKAINDLRKDLAESITNIEITLKQDQERDNSTLNERILIIKETSDNNKSKIESLEKVVPETSKSLALEVDAKMRSFHDETFDKLSAAEQKINKNRDNIESQAKIIENNTENITNIFSNNATISSQINSMENKAEDLLKYLQVERQRIDNLSSDLQDVDENLKKTVPEVKRNTDRLDSIDTTIENLAQKVVITTNKVQENDKEIEILKEKFLQQNNSLLDIGDRVNDNKDNIDKMEEKIDGLCKTVEIIEGRQVETVEKVKEVTVLFGNLQQQIKDQEEKIIEKSATDLTQIKNQIKDIESHNDLSDKKIKDLDSGSQALL